MLCYALIAASGVYVEVISNLGIGYRRLNDIDGLAEVGMSFVFVRVVVARNKKLALVSIFSNSSRIEVM